MFSEREGERWMRGDGRENIGNLDQEGDEGQRGGVGGGVSVNNERGALHDPSFRHS